MKTKNLGLDHVHFLVKNLEESIEFHKMLGLDFIEYTKHGGNACVMKAPNDNTLIELQEVGNIMNPGLNHIAGNIMNPGLNHIAFLVDNLDDFCANLKEKGIEIDGPLDNLNTGRRLATVRDQHGFLWQFVQA
jgi:catechol 2,3-dioxygenase-like lactoylglutathione lyase family enzyme